MREIKLSNWNLVRIAMVAGIIYLAANNMNGWGWLVFLLFVTMDRE